jgi:menaquinol-cytochrome c reductase iron-sulfur subunit
MADMHDPERRSALRIVSGLMMTLLSAGFSVPAVLYLLDPLQKKGLRGPSSVPLTPLAEVPDISAGAAPLRVPVIVAEQHDAWNRLQEVRLGSVWLSKSGEQLSCFSTTCPHAGCGIDFDPDRRLFVCPCHGSSFALDGSRHDGPSPRDMDRLEVEVKEGQVRCQFQRFRQAVAGKEPV